MTTYRRTLATDPELSFDPADVKPYVLPDLMRSADGTVITDHRSWQDIRRPEILAVFADQIYGTTPTTVVPTRFEVRLRDTDALGGTATRAEIAVIFGTGADEVTLLLMLYVPNAVTAPVPAFLGFNFWGNTSVNPDPAITLHTGWLPHRPDKGVVAHRATDAGRGAMARRWPLTRIINRGYAVATACYRDLDADNTDDQTFTSGIYPLLGTSGPHRRPDQWGSLGAWAWGLSRALDYLVTDPAIDHHRVAVFGHSRLGKTALWAAAQDQRFAMVISNNSGCGGASLFRHTLGERLHSLARLRPYWFAPNFGRYQLAEHTLPIDQHSLLSLIAPRPLYVASASHDQWADPVGEYLALVAAAPAYRLSGKPADLPATQPAPQNPMTGRLSYHLRAGDHDLLAYDWEHFLTAADRQWRRTRG